MEDRTAPSVTVVDNPNFVINITSSESVQVFNSAGKIAVAVNGGVPTSYGTNTIDVTSLTITASGNFDNSIDLSPLLATRFTALTNISVDGGGGTDTLYGPDLSKTWNITGINTGTITGAGFSSFNFSNIEKLRGVPGGSAADTFIFQAGGRENLINGGGGINTLQGPDLDETWNITSSNAGTIPGVVTNTFTNIQNLRGGIGNDTFTFSDGASVAGTIDGGTPGAGITDTLDYHLYTTGIGVNLQAGTAYQTGGFSHINKFVGSSVNGDLLTGVDTANTWNITSPNSGNINGAFTFQDVEYLKGGAANDTFIFSGTGSLSGSIDGGGGAGINAIVGNDAGDAFSIAGANSGAIAALLPSGFSNIQNLTGGMGNDTFTIRVGGSVSGAITGGGGSDTLVGPNADSSWNITGIDGGNITGVVNSFTGVKNLTGGTGNDTFTVVGLGHGVNGTITGGGGTDTLVGPNGTNGWNITGGDSGNIINVVNAFTGVKNLTGGTGNDTFTIGVGGSVSGAITGGGGSDTLVGPNANSSWNITGVQTGNITNVVNSFTGIQNLTGGAGDDTFTFSSSGNGNLGIVRINGGTGSTNNTIVGNDDGDTFFIMGTNSGLVAGPGIGSTGSTFANIQNLTGGAGDDTFWFFGPLTARLDGKIDGGGSAANGNSILISLAGGGGHTFNLSGANGGTIAGLLPGGFSRIQNLKGSTGQDLFVFKATGSLSGTIDGNGGGDFLDYTAKQTPVKVNLGSATVSGVSAGTASFTGGISNIQNVIGSWVGGDTLVGSGLGSVLVAHNGSNTLVAGNGRSVLIGGTSSGTLTGGTADDILIGGRTSYDGNMTTAPVYASLSTILSTWQGAGTYTARIQSLRSGTGRLVVNQTVFLNTSSTGPRFGAGGGSGQITIRGNAGMDWFFTSVVSSILDRQTGEQVN